MFAAILNQKIWIIVLCILCRLSFLDGPLQSASVEPRKKEPSTFEIHVSTYLSTFLDKTKQLCQSVSEPSQRCQSRTPRARQAWGKPLAKPLKCWCRRATRLENESEINRSLADNRTSSREDAEVRVILNTTTERNRWIFAHSGVCLPASQRERFSLSRPGSSAREG